MEFKGSYTALITPLKNGEVDEKAFQDFVEWQIAEGTNGLVPCGVPKMPLTRFIEVITFNSSS